MKLRQIGFKIVSLVMVFAMMFSISATTISAISEGIDANHSTVGNANGENKTLNYVSFGASNVNGFGLEGYLPENVTDFGQKDEYNVYGYKRAPEGSYPALLVEYFTSKGYTVNLDQLAMSSMRAEEVRVLLDNTYAGDAYTDWRFNGHNGWYHGAGKLAYAELNGIEVNGNVQHESIAGIDHVTALSYLRQVYQQDVANADLITWDCGTNNFGVYLSGRVVDGSYDETLYDISPEIAEMYEEAKAEIFELAKRELGEEKFAQIESADVEHIVDSLAYCLVAYCANYDIVLGKIYELNPDVQIISVSIQNLMKGLVATVPGFDTELPLGDIINGVITMANFYMAIGSPYADKTLYVDVSEEQHVTFFIDQLADYNGDPTTLDRDMINCWRMYNGGNMLAALEPFVFDAEGKLITAQATGNQTLHDMQLVAIDAVAKYLKVAAKLNNLDFGCLAGGDWGTVSDTGMSAIADAVAGECNRFGEYDYIQRNYYNNNDPYATFERVEVNDDFWTVLAEAKGIDLSLMNTFAAYGVRTFIGNAFYAHPNREGCGEIANEIIKVYESGKSEARPILERLYGIYSFAGENGLFEAFPEHAVLEAIYEYLYSNEYITDNQTLDILRCVYRHICDMNLSSEDLLSVSKYTYETLMHNSLLSDSDRVAIIGNVYFILKNNEYLNNITALNVVEDIYSQLDAADLITDTQSYEIVDYVYNIISDGNVTDADLLNIVRFVYYTLIKNDNSMLRYARSGLVKSNGNDAAAAETLRIIFAVISETYLNEDNKASVATLITGDNALINDQLLLKLADNVIKVLEDEESEDDLGTRLVDTLTTTILDDPDTDPSVKVQIIDEVAKMAQNNGVLGNEDEDVLELGVVGKIYQRLSDEGLLTDAQVMSIVTYLYPILISGELLNEEQVVEILAHVYDVVFNREDLTLEDKIDIVAIVYEVLEEEGYITEENVSSVINTVVDYIENNYEEMYASAHTALRNNGTIAELNAALDAAMDELAAARAELEGRELIDSLAETKALLIKELTLTEATLAEIKTLVNYETITPETLETLNLLLVIAEEHLQIIGELSLEVGGVALDQVIVAAELAAEYAVELAKLAYEYILEKAPIVYKQLVDTLTELVATKSHEAAQFVYGWLMNNPEKVLEFFDVYGDDIVDFISDNGKYIAAVLGFVGYTYGEELLFFVLENADVILPAVVGWFEIHGDLVWDLLVVYFNAIVEHYGIFDTVHGIINEVYTELGKLLDMIKEGGFDYVESLGIVDLITNLLAKLNYVLDGYSEQARELGEYIFELIMNFIDDAIRGEFTPTEDTY